MKMTEADVRAHAAKNALPLPPGLEPSLRHAPGLHCDRCAKIPIFEGIGGLCGCGGTFKMVEGPSAEPPKASIPLIAAPPAGPAAARSAILAQDSGSGGLGAQRSKWQFTIPGAPIGKPRMTRRDKWKKRPAVVKYRDWADRARAAAPASLPAEPISVSWVAYLPLPKSWRKPLQDAMRGQLHRHKPDRDNIDKAVLDALFKNDAGVCQGTLEKRWDDGFGPRLVVTVVGAPTHG